ncbi:hypothetical protein TREES_T100012203 [Tupaia chinensis]|uniref:Uncharacterized protein n=1 Tax=Tupaia chinensis TaxID=246437 RepID=L9JHL7_TUPCH|nr:hypothetical protein TREES_T100012203 [Tupaia chinensis]
MMPRTRNAKMNETWYLTCELMGRASSTAVIQQPECAEGKMRLFGFHKPLGPVLQASARHAAVGGGGKPELRFGDKAVGV